MASCNPWGFSIGSLEARNGRSQNLSVLHAALHGVVDASVVAVGTIAVASATTVALRVVWVLVAEAVGRLAPDLRSLLCNVLGSPEIGLVLLCCLLSLVLAYLFAVVRLRPGLLHGLIKPIA
jgi:hypothetical protein